MVDRCVSSVVPLPPSVLCRSSSSLGPLPAQRCDYAENNGNIPTTLHVARSVFGRSWPPRLFGYGNVSSVSLVSHTAVPGSHSSLPPARGNPQQQVRSTRHKLRPAATHPHGSAPDSPGPGNGGVSAPAPGHRAPVTRRSEQLCPRLPPWSGNTILRRSGGLEHSAGGWRCGCRSVGRPASKQEEAWSHERCERR